MGDYKDKMVENFVLAPMTQCCCDNGGAPKDELVEYYAQMARSGFKLIIVEGAAINSSTALGYVGGAQLHKGVCLDGWSKLVREVKKSSTSKIILQLYHASRLSLSASLPDTALAPSCVSTGSRPSFWRPVKNGTVVHFQTNSPFQRPKALSRQEILRIFDEFAEACYLASDVGFDGVELHGAHGYLLHLFTSRANNLRQDEFRFSSFEFTRQLIQRCKRSLKSSDILSYRLSTHMIDNPCYSISDLGLKTLVPIIDRSGVNIIHSSELNVGSASFRSSKSLGEEIRCYTELPIIGCGGVKSTSQARKILDNPSLPYSYIAFGRSALINKRLPTSPEEGKFIHSKHLVGSGGVA